MKDIRRPMINDALRLLRLYVGLSQKQLSERIEISQSMISDVEKGNKSVSMELLEKYSSNLNIRMSELLFFAEEINDGSFLTRGKLIVAPRVIALLDRLAPTEISDAT